MSHARKRFADLGWKLVALICAFGLWLVVVEEKQALRQLEVPVRFENRDSALAIAGERLSSVVVRVQAAEGIVKDLQPPDIDVLVDLTSLGAGTHTLRLRPDSPAISPRRPGVKVVEVFPSHIKVQLERRITVEVPVTPKISGTPTAGYEVLSVSATPATVRIVGPQSAVEATAAAHTLEISVENRRAPFENEVVIDVESPDIQLLDAARAHVAVDIGEKMGERRFENVPVAALSGDYEARVRPGRSDVTLSGPERLLEQLTVDDLVTFVDIKDLAPKPGDYRLDVQVVISREQYRRRIAVKTLSHPVVSVRILDRKVATDDEASRGG